jgi:radical SAM superfamily enzyme YgiQ (UPF0313 family)
MKVSLVFPPFSYQALYSLAPLGLINLATGLKLAGHEPAIHDFVLDLREGGLPMGQGLYQACAEKILAEDPELVGFSAQCTTYPAMINLARELKRLKPELTLVAGGHNATFVDRETLAGYPEFAAVVRSEGEAAFAEVVEAVVAGNPLWEIPGVTARRDGQVVRAPDRPLLADLDDLPLPDYSLAPPLERYQRAYDLQRAIAILEVGRGCPHKCVYCSESAMWRGRARTFSVPRIVAEMARLREQGAGCFLLSYDQFTTDRAFVRRFCQAVLEHGLEDCGWYCISRLDTVDPELFALMRRAGCESMCYGIDSGSPRTLAYINKRIDESLLYQRVRQTTEHGMTPTLSFIIGFPEEQLADIDATLNLALRCGIQGNVSPLMQMPTVLPGTALHAKHHRNLVRERDTYFALGLEFDNGHRLEMDEALINSDPAMFSSFYNLPCPGLGLGELGALADSFPLVVEFFPKTFLVLAQSLQTSPALLFLGFLAQAQGQAQGPMSPEEFYRLFPPFIEGLLSGEIRRAWPVLPQIFRYEKLCVAAAGARETPKPGEGRPARRGGVLVGDFPMDMPQVVADLKAGLVQESYPAKETTLIFAHDGHRLEVLGVNEFGKDVLELCDGEHTLDQMARLLRPLHGADMEQDLFAAHCHKAVLTFEHMGLLAP